MCVTHAHCVQMPLEEWKFFNERVKKDFTILGSLRCLHSNGVSTHQAKVGGKQEAMSARLYKCPNRPKYTNDDEQAKPQSSTKKRKSSQTTFVLSTKGVPFSKEEFGAFEKQALYAVLDANLAFQWTDSRQVKKLCQMIKPEL
eukprot:TRINITY_DN7274_c0_g1_i1.p1 TRINITY_DN7274_c0_g1~~TRINITY_DN7274_c0_g1_i1.p1  ORF type:complete len:143 (+),score=20.05 TRINITY_DN7274_c0_g1_i1:51-479(+)